MLGVVVLGVAVSVVALFEVRVVVFVGLAGKIRGWPGVRMRLGSVSALAVVDGHVRG